MCHRNVISFFFLMEASKIQQSHYSEVLPAKQLSVSEGKQRSGVIGDSSPGSHTRESHGADHKQMSGK